MVSFFTESFACCWLHLWLTSLTNADEIKDTCYTLAYRGIVFLTLLCLTNLSIYATGRPLALRQTSHRQPRPQSWPISTPATVALAFRAPTTIERQVSPVDPSSQRLSTDVGARPATEA